MANYSTKRIQTNRFLRFFWIDVEPYSIASNEMVTPGKGQAFNLVRDATLKTWPAPSERNLEVRRQPLKPPTSSINVYAVAIYREADFFQTSMVPRNLSTSSHGFSKPAGRPRTAPMGSKTAPFFLRVTL